MGNKHTMSQHRPPDHADQSARLSRRRLLVTGTGALVGALPVFAAATSVGAENAADQPTIVDPASDRRRRIAAILERHGPELGSSRAKR